MHNLVTLDAVSSVQNCFKIRLRPVYFSTFYVVITCCPSTHVLFFIFYLHVLYLIIIYLIIIFIHFLSNVSYNQSIKTHLYNLSYRDRIGGEI